MFFAVCTCSKKKLKSVVHAEIGCDVHMPYNVLQVKRLQLGTGKAEQEADNIRQKREQATELKKGLIEKLELQR